MNRLETISILLAAWLAVAFEVSFNGFRNWFGAQVSLLPALMVYVALTSSLPSVVLLAIVGGLAQDSFSANPLGVTTVALALTGFLIHYKRDIVLRDQIYAQVMMGFLGSSLVPACVVLALTNSHHPVPLTARLAGQWVVMAVGGAAYLVSKAIIAAKVVAFPELGMEAIYEFEVKDMPVSVAVDTSGASVHEIGPRIWRAKIAEQAIEVA